MDDELVRCPFCKEPDFDLIGLKHHLRLCRVHHETHAYAYRSGGKTPTLSPEPVKTEGGVK